MKMQKKGLFFAIMAGFMLMIFLLPSQITDEPSAVSAVFALCGVLFFSLGYVIQKYQLASWISGFDPKNVEDIPAYCIAQGRILKKMGIFSVIIAMIGLLFHLPILLTTLAFVIVVVFLAFTSVNVKK